MTDISLSTITDTVIDKTTFKSLKKSISYVKKYCFSFGVTSRYARQTVLVPLGSSEDRFRADRSFES